MGVIASTMKIRFAKMHGVGNDFMIMRWPSGLRSPAQENISRWGDRRRGIGFDQLAVLRAPQEGGDVFVRFFNSDGSESAACGNGTRCIAAHLMQADGTDTITIETESGLLPAHYGEDGLIAVDKRTKARALGYVSDLYAGGGTAIESALSTSLG